MRILNSGGLTSPTNLIAGLMARASELPGDRFRTAAGELNSFLASAKQAGSDELLDGLDIGYDAVLFFGLTVKKRTDKRYSEMAMVVGRLSEALTRDSRFSGADRILDVAIALERMYMLDHRKISRKLQDRAAWYLTTN